MASKGPLRIVPYPWDYIYLKNRGRPKRKDHGHDGQDSWAISVFRDLGNYFDQLVPDRFEWISKEPIIGAGGKWNLWVRFEPAVDSSVDVWRYGGGSG